MYDFDHVKPCCFPLLRYGDKVPKTRLGMMVGVVWMMVSVLLIASMTSIITGKFSDYSIELEDGKVSHELSPL